MTAKCNDPNSGCLVLGHTERLNNKKCFNQSLKDILFYKLTKYIRLCL